MTIAFAHFDEPLAWLLRGLITYGWADSTLNRVTPANVVGGFDLSLIPESQGKSGLILRISASADGRRCHEDDTYAFEVVLTHVGSERGFAVRCEDCNYLAEFVFDPANPEWAAGYIHQGITEYVAEFVRWRLGGGELTWAQRQGVPEVVAEPCSASLAGWIGQQVALRRHFDASLWGTVQNVAQARGVVTQPMVTEGNYGVTTGGQGAPASMALERPAKALLVMIGLGATSAVMALLNIVVTLALFGMSRPFAITTNFLLMMVAGVGGVFAWYGLREFKQMRGDKLPWVAIIYPSVIPICCLAGIPISIWAGRAWQSEPVLSRRAANSAK